MALNLSINDIRNRGWKVHQADADAAVSTPIRVMSVYISAGTGAASASVNDAATKAGGGTTLTTSAGATGGNQLFLGPKGILFEAAASVSFTITDAGAGATGGFFYID